ncbi:MAG TPA: DUF222 domain-containing protein [Nocardioides sp.]|nr:DUF222 domain-containing protein [Nocardioides sp.]
MFDHLDRRAAMLDAVRVRACVEEVAHAPDLADDGARLELIRALEELKCAAEIALARRVSLHRGQQHLALATVLRAEMPFTRDALRTGRITGWRATIIARETACVSRKDRGEIDRCIAGDPERLERMGDRELGNAVRRLTYEADAESWVTRRRTAESERRVTLRPAPDVMSRLSAELPVAQGVAVLRTLGEHADAPPRHRRSTQSRSADGRHAGRPPPRHRAADRPARDDARRRGRRRPLRHTRGVGPSRRIRLHSG